jgi:NADPH-dependent curcumin reductase
MNRINRKVTYARIPDGAPTVECFAMAEEQVPALAEGQVLVANRYLSVDPYIRMRMERRDSYAPVMTVGSTMVGRTAGEVIESRSAGMPVGTHVVGRLGWQDFSVATAGELEVIDTDKAPMPTYLGALGSTGITAWVGLTEFGRPQQGETVLVSAAGGAVGSVVGQMARRLGCRVVGIAGGPEKCAFVRKQYRFDQCVDYKADDFAEQLAEAAGDGYDVYFDNVGGPIFDTVLPLMRLFGRIPVCGLVSQYNATEPYGVKNMREVFNKRLTLRGFVLSDHKDLWPQAVAELQTAYAEGTLVHRDTITNGLESAPQAFIDMLGGASVGKQLVRIAGEDAA